jgi:hypothetical protein
MTPAVKAVIIIFVCVSIVVLTVAGSGVYWWTHNRDKLLQGTKRTLDEGREFGKNTDNDGCVTEALSRHKQDRGFISSISQSLFVRACLESSQPSTGFCDGVPSKNQIISGAQWQVRKCKEAGLSDQYCQQIFAQVQEYCDSKREKNE